MLKRKLLSMLLAISLVFSIGAMSAFASDDEIPASLPEGTIKIAEGIYAYTPDVMPADYSSNGFVNIGTVPKFNTCSQPGVFNNIVVDSNDEFLCFKCDSNIRVNLVSATQNVFGYNMSNWPNVGSTNGATTYYVGINSYNIQSNVNYQLQCTSATSRELYNVMLSIKTQ